MKKIKKEDGVLWRQRFLDLTIELQNIVERVHFRQIYETEKEPITNSKELFVSHDMECCDNEECSEKYWNGRYRRFVLDEAFVPKGFKGER